MIVHGGESVVSREFMRMNDNAVAVEVWYGSLV